MYCNGCIWSVFQRYQNGMDVNEIWQCVWVGDRVNRRLTECSKREVLPPPVVEEVKHEVVDLGYGAISKKKGWPLGKKRK